MYFTITCAFELAVCFTYHRIIETHRKRQRLVEHEATTAGHQRSLEMNTNEAGFTWKSFSLRNC